MSDPNSKLTLPGFPKSGSANYRSRKWFHLWLNETGSDGRSDVTLEKTIASTSKCFPSPSICVMSKCTIPRGVQGEPPIPLILTLWWLHGTQSNCTNHSIINEVDDSESNKALAQLVEPSGPWTSTWHVMSNSWRQFPNCDFGYKMMFILWEWQSTGLLWALIAQMKLCTM